jgi:effector-binding domain-containing protein
MVLEIVQKPWVESRNEVSVLEIAIDTPMKGMFQVSDKLWKELSRYVSSQGIVEDGPYYLRFCVIDMEGEMGICVGVPVKEKVRGNGRVTPFLLPKGEYACLKYIGHGLVANKMLLAWINDRNLVMDRWEDPKGDAFKCRRETFLTDRRVQPQKKKWTIELSIKLED